MNQSKVTDDDECNAAIYWHLPGLPVGIDQHKAIVQILPVNIEFHAVVSAFIRLLSFETPQIHMQRHRERDRERQGDRYFKLNASLQMSASLTKAENENCTHIRSSCFIQSHLVYSMHFVSFTLLCFDLYRYLHLSFIYLDFLSVFPPFSERKKSLSNLMVGLV